VEHWGKLGNTPNVEEKGGVSQPRWLVGGKTAVFWQWWPPGGSAAREGEGESEGQPDWRREVHGGELTEAATMAASKLATSMCLRWPVQMRCKGGGAQWMSYAVRLGKKRSEEERGRWRALDPF
jgi:hypothetical protein